MHALCVFILILTCFSSHADSKSDQTNIKQVLILGDSLSAAYKLPKEQGWVNVLRQSLQRQGSPLEITNASISGLTVGGGLQILPSLLATSSPDLIVLELGANDGLQGKTPQSIHASLNELVQIAKNSGAKVLLIGIQLPPNLGKRYTEPFFAIYADIAQQQKIEHLPFLLEGVALKPELNQSDGIHPNEQGVIVISKTIEKNIIQTRSSL